MHGIEYISYTECEQVVCIAVFSISYIPPDPAELPLHEVLHTILGEVDVETVKESP